MHLSVEGQREQSPRRRQPLLNPVLPVNSRAYLVNGVHVRLCNPILVISWTGFPILISLSLGGPHSVPPLDWLSWGQVVGNIILRQPPYKKFKGVVSLHASHSVPLVG